MTPSDFISQYREFFGPAVGLPIAVIYTDQPLDKGKGVPGCMFKQFHRAYNGDTVTLSADNFTCIGGKFYTGLGPANPGIFNFVSAVEKYKQTPATAKASIEAIGPKLSDKPFINFIRIDRLDAFDNIEGLMFFATPDVISGLFMWANFDQEDVNAVQSPFGSGCSATVTALVNENRRNGKHCYLGMFDPSARIYFKKDILSFSIPMSRFAEMQDTLPQCCVAESAAWLKLRKRINQ